MAKINANERPELTVKLTRVSSESLVAEYHRPGHGQVACTQPKSIRSFGQGITVRNQSGIDAINAGVYADATNKAARRTPHAGTSGFHGSLTLARDPDGRYRLAFDVSAGKNEARESEPLRYEGRDRRAAQDWLRLPVSGVSCDDAEAYAAYAVGLLPLPFVDLYAKAGVARWETDVRTTGLLPASRDDSGTEFAWGAGVQARLGSLAARLEYERFDVAGTDGAKLLSLGLTWTFL